MFTDIWHMCAPVHERVKREKEKTVTLNTVNFEMGNKRELTFSSLTIGAVTFSSLTKMTKTDNLKGTSAYPLTKEQHIAALSTPSRTSLLNEQWTGR